MTGTPQGLSRPLALSEAIYVPTQLTAVASGAGTGTVDVEAMAKAFEAVRAEFPLLAGRVEQRPEGFVFVVPENPPPGSVRVHADGVGAMPRGKAAVLDPTVELSAIDLVNEGGRFRFTMLVCHSVCDGKGSVGFVLRVLAQYAALIDTGELLPFERHPLPDSLEQVLADRGIVAGPESGLEKVLPLLDKEPPPQVFGTQDRPRAVRMQLTEEETSRLKALGKEHSISVHGVITGILALVEHEFAGRPAEMIVPVYTIVDLRDRIDPPVALLAGTVLLGFSVSMVAVTPASDVFEIGRKILSDLGADLDSGLVQQSHLHLPALLGRVAQTQAAGLAPMPRSLVSLSNVGAIPTIPSAAGLVFEDCHGSTENLSPAELGQPDQPDLKQYNRAYVILTSEGQACIEFRASGPAGALDEELPLYRMVRGLVDQTLEGGRSR